MYVGGVCECVFRGNVCVGVAAFVGGYVCEWVRVWIGVCGGGVWVCLCGCVYGWAFGCVSVRVRVRACMCEWVRVWVCACDYACCCVCVRGCVYRGVCGIVEVLSCVGECVVGA